MTSIKDIPSSTTNHTTKCQYQSQPQSPLPLSPLYSLKSTPTSGRGIFATRDIPSGTVLLDTLSSTSPVSSPTTTTETITDDKLVEPSTIEIGGKGGSEPLSPISHVIFRTYRKEVCAWCFKYDRGREWKVRLAVGDGEVGGFDEDGIDGGGGSGGSGESKNSSDKISGGEGQDTGLLFCSEQCRGEWYSRYGELGVQAFAKTEAVTRKLAGRMGKGRRRDDEVLDQDGMDGMLVFERGTETGPSKDEVERAWAETARMGSKIVEARKKEKLSKADRKVLKMAGEPEEFDGDILYYVLTGVLSAYIAMKGDMNDVSPRDEKNQQEDTGLVVNGTNDKSHITPLDELDPVTQLSIDEPSQSTQNGQLQHTELNCSSQISRTLNPEPTSNEQQDSQEQPFPLPSLQTLTPSSSPSTYPPFSPLSLHTRIHLLLLTLLPIPLLPYLQPQLTHELTARATHNAFSLRPAGSTDGEESGEFMGWGVWPAASFFNHSCGPNVKKVRHARGWRFWVDDDYRSVRQCQNVKTRSNDSAKKEAEGEKDMDAHGRAEGIREGAELCITYLGGEEKEMNFQQRRKRLQGTWGFWCMCWRCIQEEGNSQISNE